MPKKNNSAPLHNQRGTTLVELLVCTALLGLFCAAAVALVGPCSRMLLKMQNLNRGQAIAEVIAKDLRREVLHAEGPVRLATAGLTEGGAETVFGKISNGATAIEFLTESGNVELIDAGYVPATGIYKKDAHQRDIAAQPAGKLHFRYFAGGTVTREGLQYPSTQGGGYIAREYADAHGTNFYMGNTITLEFSDWVLSERSTLTIKYLRCLTATITVYDTAGAPIGSRKAVLDFDNAPRFIPPENTG